MKKMLVTLASVLVLLTSCTENTDTVKNPADPNVFYLSSLPEIGGFSGKIGGGRYYDELTYDFIPSDDYGMIIPFISSYRLFETPEEEGSDWYAKQGYASYGFCTPDGKIIMDASDKNADIYYRQTEDGFGFYTVIREIQQKVDAPDEYTATETWVIPTDGSWCLTLDEMSWVTSAGEGVICVCSYAGEAANAGVRTLIYDYDGNLVRTIEGVDSSGAYSQGLMLVSNWTSSGYTAYFVNDEGEKVLGPYSSASDFTKHGLTAVEDENGAYIINTAGERLTDYYDSFFKEYSYDSKCVAFVGRRNNNKNVSDVYSEKGDFLGTLSGSTYFSFRFPDNGEIYGYYTVSNDDKYSSFSDKMIWKCLSDGSDFVSEEFGVSPNKYSGTDNCYVHLDKENSRAYIFDGNGKTIADISNADDVVSTSEYGEYVIYTEGEYDYSYDEVSGLPKEDTRKTHIYDSGKKEIVYSIPSSGANAYFSDIDKRYIIITVYERDGAFFDEGKYWLFDTESGEIVFEEANHIKLFNVDGKTYINVCTDNCASLYNDRYKLIHRNYFE